MIKTNLITNLILFLFLFGCSDNHYRNQEPIQVDFEDTKTQNNEISSNNDETIYVAIATMITPKETFLLYENLLNYIGKKVGVPIKLKQRRTYEEVNELLKEGKLDFAFVCSGAYVIARREFPLKILAAPVVNGRPYYQAYLIVNKESGIKNFLDFKGKSFAFSDPLSNSGYKYALKLIKEKGYNPENFFKKTIFTYAHDNSIQAVARGLVDGATIDGLVYEYLKKRFPERVSQVKIIKKSEWFGIPPFVYVPKKSDELINQIQKVLINMHKDEEGRKILENLDIEKFEIVDPKIYNDLELFN
jgi:phosphate/phosphite/phosphonate ABC transporter binding protein